MEMSRFLYEVGFDFSQKYQTVPRPNRRATVYFGTQLISVGCILLKNLNVGPANRPAFCRQVPLFFYEKCPSKNILQVGRSATESVGDWYFLAFACSLCGIYGLEHDIRFNSKKSAVIIFRNSSVNDFSYPCFVMNGESIKDVLFVKYLGHVISADMKDDLDIMRQCRQLYAQSNALLVVCSDNVKVTVFALIVRRCTLRNCGGNTRLTPSENYM